MAGLIEKLPDVRGKYIEGQRLDALTWFRVGGPADVLYTPENHDDLVLFRRECPADIPVRVVGVGSNLLVRDGGLDGVTIRLAGGFNKIEIEGDIVQDVIDIVSCHLRIVGIAHGNVELEVVLGIEV